jgi:NADPH2:quinone reductase
MVNLCLRHDDTERDMTNDQIGTARQLYSTVKKEGLLALSLADVPIPPPQDDGVVVRVEAAPINPSDLGLLFGPADMSTIQVSGTADHPVVTVRIPSRLMPVVASRVDQPMPVGNEGAGVMVKAGSSTSAQALMGKTVAMSGGAMYTQFRVIKAAQCADPVFHNAAALDSAVAMLDPSSPIVHCVVHHGGKRSVRSNARRAGPSERCRTQNRMTRSKR